MRAPATILAFLLLLLAAPARAAVEQPAPTDEAVGVQPEDVRLLPREDGNNGLPELLPGGPSFQPVPDASPLSPRVPQTSALRLGAAVALRTLELPEASAVPAGHLRLPGRKNYVIPALETLIFNFGLYSLNNYVGQMEFARVRWSDIAEHLDGRNGWTFDSDGFVVNQAGHPFQGALVHTAARSSGLSFWEGFIYTFLSSLLWELALERDPPAINDQITTTLGGVFLGEALHRSFIYLTDDSRGPVPVVNRIAASILSPASALNDWMLADEMERGDVSEKATHLGTFEIGATVATQLSRSVGDRQTGFFYQGPQVFIGGDLEYGVPADDQRNYARPFSHYAVNVDAAFPRVPLLNLFIRGLLTGHRYGGPDQGVHGLLGVFGLYDMSSNHDVRVSTVGVGLGSTLRAKSLWGTEWHLTGIAGGVALGAAGSFGLSSGLEIEPGVRDYQFGPGVNGILEASLIKPGFGKLALRGRTWRVFGVVAPREGFEWITYGSLEARWRVARQLAVGVDIPLMTRVHERVQEPGIVRTSVGSNPRLVLTYSTDDVLFTRTP